MTKRTSVGTDKPRLDRKKAWGYWFATLDGKTLVFDRPESGNYQLSLAALDSLEAARQRVEDVAHKTGWATQRIVDDLRRAIRDLTKHAVAAVDVAGRIGTP